MKKLLTLILCCVLMVCFAGCGGSTPTYKLLGRKWAENKTEIFTYDVTLNEDEGNKDAVAKGTLVRSIKKVTTAEFGTLKFDDISAYLVESNFKFGKDTINQKVLFSSAGVEETFPPIASYRTSFIGGVYRTEQISYNGENLQCWQSDTAEISADAEPISHEIKFAYYDNQQIYTIIRACDINKNLALNFNTFIPLENDIVKIATKYLGTENVTSNLDKKSINCSKITIYRNQKISGSPNIAYYSTQPLEIDGQKFTQVLVKMQESDCTYTLKSIEIK